MFDRPAAILAAERERWILWFPVAVGAGVAAFFALPADPPAYVAWGLVAAAVPAVWFARTRSALSAAAAAVFAVALGFAAAELRTLNESGPMLRRAVGPLPLTGRIVNIEGSGTGVRITLDQVATEGRGRDDLPRKVRLRYAAGGERPPAGAVVSLRARLLPSSPPASPGAYDFQRHAFFQGIGAVGFVAGPLTVVSKPPARFAGGLALEMERWREIVAARVAAAVDGPSAGIVGALMHGEKSFVEPVAMQAIRDSGLAHLLAISGLHIGLVAGIVLYVVRALLALIPYIALRWPINKIAAVCGLAAAVAYTALVGPSAPAVRSTLMTGLALAAVMSDRNPFSMRLVGFAAVVVLLLLPETLPGPSFQMSFAAVVALIAAYEVAAGPLARLRAGVGPIWRPGLYVGALALTSVVATLATAPFSAYHFQTVPTYGVLANLAAVPLTGMWVMPMILLAYLLTPFGWEGPALTAAGWGVDLILLTAELTAALPGAVINIPAMPLVGLIVAVAGGLWLALWRTSWRLWGLPLIVIGLASPWFADRPEVLVSDDGGLVAVRLADGKLALSSGRSRRFLAETWLRREGWSREEIAAGPPVWPLRGATADGVLSCDAEACLYRRNGRTVSLVRRPGALAEDCATADAVVTALQAGRRCKAGVVVDADALRRGGAAALYVRPEGITMRTVNDERGNRAWTQ